MSRDEVAVTGRVWLDVEDIFEYAALTPRLSGIQRVVLEVCRALVAWDPEGAHTGFVRHSPEDGAFRVISWASVEAVAERLNALAAAPRDGQHGTAARPPEWRPGPLRRLFRRFVQWLPTRPRHLFVMFIVEQRQALATLLALLRGCVRGFGSTAAPQPDRPAEGAVFAALARPGDVVVVLGAIWYHPDYAGVVRANCQALGLRFGVLIHDLIPLRRPEWVDRNNVATFRHWFTTTIGMADHILSVSRATGDDLVRYAAQHGIALRGRPQVIPLGTGFSAPATAAAPADAPPRPLPCAGSYALIVSTLEARKNHLLLFRVWRRLLDEMPAAQVPTLVFAGRIGWMVADLMAQLRNCDFLDGRIVHVEDPTDRELAQLYDGCLFTLYPSFYEGWGLPVTESLAFGRPCIIANTTSLPEAGGALARYFDPDCPSEAYEVIRDVLADPAALAAWRERVRREFRPAPWAETAAAVLRAVQPE